MAAIQELERNEPLPIKSIGIELLQNALHELDLPYSHINESNIQIKDPRNWFFRRGRGRLIDESKGFIDEETNTIIVLDGTEDTLYPPSVLLTIQEHEGGHFIGAEMLSRILHTYENTNIVRRGYKLDIGGMRFFRALDEASAHEFATFALNKGQHILAQYPELAGTRITPAEKDIDGSYVSFRLTLSSIKKMYGKHFSLSDEAVERLFLRGMASPNASFLIGLENVYDSDALIMLGLYGTMLISKTWWQTSYEREDDGNRRNYLINGYFQTDDNLLANTKLLNSIRVPEEIKNDPKAIRRFIATKVKGLVEHFDKNVYKTTLQLPQIARAVFAGQTSN